MQEQTRKAETLIDGEATIRKVLPNELWVTGKKVGTDWVPRLSRVLVTKSYPPGLHPAGCPIQKDWTAVEARTADGSRWFGCARAYISPRLEFVLVWEGKAAWHKRRDEVVMGWRDEPATFDNGGTMAAQLYGGEEAQ